MEFWVGFLRERTREGELESSRILLTIRMYGFWFSLRVHIEYLNEEKNPLHVFNVSFKTTSQPPILITQQQQSQTITKGQHIC